MEPVQLHHQVTCLTIVINAYACIVLSHYYTTKANTHAFMCAQCKPTNPNAWGCTTIWISKPVVIAAWQLLMYEHIGPFP